MTGRRPRGRAGLALLVALLLALGLAGAPAWARPRAAPVPADRWVEIDLYWFDAADPERSALAYWRRFAPLYRDVAGYKGVVLSVGLTAAFILDFTGDLDQPIPLPAGRGQELGARVAGQLDGDTAERQRAWRARFAATAQTSAGAGYGAWTYRRLARLAAALRAAAQRDGVADFRVAAFATATDNAYGEPIAFAAAHPEAFTHWGTPGSTLANSYYDPAARLLADPRPRAGLPRGIPAGLGAGALLAAQWGALSARVGLDGLMLRDCFGFQRTETRYGPWGANLPEPTRASAITDALAAMIKAIKLANPRALTMMYSSAASATGDWRGNGVDLEGVARAGYLDIFVDQTWAGAWGEAGVRRQTFWNAPILGWTFQLGYLLQHAAVLATSRVRHYHLVEAFDAWESWDTIHTAPERLRWGIWAYSHAAVLTPRGPRVPAGAYLSWANHGPDLLAAADVAWLAAELGAAQRDAAAVDRVYGATLVYARDAAREQLRLGATGGDPRDRLDETAALLAKWPLPFLSATRLEWLGEVRPDLALLGATAGLAPADTAMLAGLARGGQALALLAAPGDTDPALAALAGVAFAPYAPPLQDRSLRAVRGDGATVPVAGVAGFDAAPVPRQATPLAGAAPVYAAGPSAALVVAAGPGRNTAWWSPPPLDDAWYLPLRALVKGGTEQVVLADAALNRQLAAAGAPHAALVDLAQSGAVAAWRTRDGAVSILAGNLEEGLRDDADRSRHVALALPAAWRGTVWRPAWPAPPATVTVTAGGGDGELVVRLPPAGSVLLRGGPAAASRVEAAPATRRGAACRRQAPLRSPS